LSPGLAPARSAAGFWWLPIPCTALLAVAVLLVRGNSCGHDFDFHLLSWMEVARAWHTGLLHPHWVLDANYGAGEPRLIFYPPASWLLGAALGVLTSWHAAPIPFVLVALLLGGSAMYLLAREWVPAPGAAFAACLYIANPYALFVAYERTAYGELLAGAWLPLLVLFALRRKRSMAALGLAVAALWLTNSPAAVVGSYLLALLAVAMWIAEKNPWPAVRAAGGMLLGLGLAAFYIVPAAYEQRWVQIERAITPGMRVQDSFLFAHTADAFHDQVLHAASWIFVAECAVACVAAWVAWRKGRGGTARATLTAMLPIIFLLQLPLSAMIWQYAPHLKFLQFPWRWLMALSVIACVLAAMALGRARWVAAVAASAMVAMTLGFGLLFFQPCDDDDAVAGQMAVFRSGQGVVGTDEYTPKGTDNASVQQNLPLVRMLRGAEDDMVDSTNGDNPQWHGPAAGAIAAEVSTRRPQGEHWMVHIFSPVPGFAVLRLMDYPSWGVRVDGKTLSFRPHREDGLLTVPLPAGSHAIDVRWTATRDIVAGDAVSCGALLLLITVMVWERKLEHKERLAGQV
jgi:hypothetical protein